MTTCAVLKLVAILLLHCHPPDIHLIYSASHVRRQLIGILVKRSMFFLMPPPWVYLSILFEMSYAQNEVVPLLTFHLEFTIL